MLLGNNQGITSSWRGVIERYLQEMEGETKKSFVYLSSYDMVGIATFVFISAAMFNRVVDHEWYEIKTGFNNSLGNKGAIMLFMQIDNTFFTIGNCHLTAGESSSSERIQDIEYIHNDALN